MGVAEVGLAVEGSVVEEARAAEAMASTRSKS